MASDRLHCLLRLTLSICFSVEPCGKERLADLAVDSRTLHPPRHGRGPISLKLMVDADMADSSSHIVHRSPSAHPRPTQLCSDHEQIVYRDLSLRDG